MAEIKGKKVKVNVNKPLKDGASKTKTIKIKKFKNDNLEFKKEVSENKKLLEIFDNVLDRGVVELNLTPEEKEKSKELFLRIQKELDNIENNSIKYNLIEIKDDIKDIFKNVLAILSNIWFGIIFPFRAIWKKIIKWFSKDCY